MNDQRIGASFLFKHSTTCPISAKANEEVHQFAENYDGKDAEFAFLKVRESRPVSNAIEADLQIKHESPQFFIIENKEVKWCDSHWNITKEKMRKHCKRFNKKSGDFLSCRFFYNRYVQNRS